MATSSRSSRSPGSSRAGTAGPQPTTTARPWWRRWWAALLVLPALVAGVVGLLLFFFLFASVPLPEDVGAAPTVVLDAAGNEFGTLNPQAERQDLALEQLPEHVRQAVMAAEDRRFYEHQGVSVTGIVRALFANARAGGVTQGGSTITQQYVKNSLVGNDRTFLRKAKEASLALKLEQRFAKEKILEMYLNTIYWGRGAYGIEAAAQTYYGKSATELTLNESALLAGMIQAPEALDPADGPDAEARAENRRTYVLNGMRGQGWIDEDTHTEVLAAELPMPTTGRQTVEYGEGAYYLDAVRRELERQLGAEEVYTGLTVHTELDRDFQLAAEATLSEAVGDAAYTGAIVSVDPRNGGVRALVGGADFASQQFNTAIRSARQVGSSFKPFTLASFVEAGYSPESRFDAPATIEVPDVGGGTREVNNYDRRDHGVEDLYAATRRSTNTVYIQVQEAIGGDRVIDLATRLGLPQQRTGSSEPVMEPYPTLTLGVDEFTPLEMASAYATLASGGVRTRPHLVTRVIDADGETIYQVRLDQNAVMEANDAYIVTDVLRGVVASGTGTAAQIGRPAAGKTGTTNGYTDAWFAGYVPQLATAVWIGNMDNTPLEGEITGGSVPAQVWGSYMRTALEKVEIEDFPGPDLSRKDVLNAPPSPAPSPSPTPEPSPTESPDCPSDDEDSIVGELLDDEDPSCPDTGESPTPSPAAEPSPEPTATTEPTEKPQRTEEPNEPASEEPTREPTPAGGTDGGGEPAPEPSPTG